MISRDKGSWLNVFAIIAVIGCAVAALLVAGLITIAIDHNIRRSAFPLLMLQPAETQTAALQSVPETGLLICKLDGTYGYDE